jgi:hypothetical protein
MEWAYFVQDCRAVFLLAYAIFVAWSLVRWIIATGKSEYVLRDWLGSLGLAAGICSAVLFAWFYVYVWTEHRLIAHGIAQGLYFLAGGCLAVFGLILGLTGRRWVRRSAAIVALVMVFQWWGEMLFHLKEKSAVTIAMFVSLLAIGFALLVSQRFIHKFQRSHIRQS